MKHTSTGHNMSMQAKPRYRWTVKPGNDFRHDSAACTTGMVTQVIQDKMQ